MKTTTALRKIDTAREEGRAQALADVDRQQEAARLAAVRRAQEAEVRADDLQRSADYWQTKARENAMLVDDENCKLIAVTAERDQLRQGERERFELAAEMLRAMTEKVTKKLQAELADATRDIGIYRDRMEAACAERDQVKQRLWREVDGPGSVMGAWQARAKKAETERDRLVAENRTLVARLAELEIEADALRTVDRQRSRAEEEERDRLQAANICLGEQMRKARTVALYYANLHDGKEHQTYDQVESQMCSDAGLGRLVRAMPRGAELYHTWQGTEWRVQTKMHDHTQKFGDSPEETLRAAGVTLPQAGEESGEP